MAPAALRLGVVALLCAIVSFGLLVGLPPSNRIVPTILVIILFVCCLIAAISLQPLWKSWRFSARLAGGAAAAAAVTGLVLAHLQILPNGGNGPNPAPMPTPVTRSPTIPTSQTLLKLVDVSGSTRNADLVSLGEQEAMTELRSMPIGNRLVVQAFSARPGAACTPLEVALDKQRNGNSNLRLREQALAGFPEAYKRHVSCFTRAPATEIFGAISEGLTHYPEAETPVVITDGCNSREGPNTCDRKQLMDPDFPERVVKQLSEDWPALCRALPGVTHITFKGVGRGSELNASQLAGLRNVWTAWGKACAHTTIKFK